LARNVPFVPKAGVPTRYFRISSAFPSLYTWMIRWSRRLSRPSGCAHSLLKAKLCQRMGSLCCHFLTITNG